MIIVEGFSRFVQNVESIQGISQLASGCCFLKKAFDAAAEVFTLSQFGNYDPADKFEHAVTILNGISFLQRTLLLIFDSDRRPNSAQGGLDLMQSMGTELFFLVKRHLPGSTIVKDTIGDLFLCFPYLLDGICNLKGDETIHKRTLQSISTVWDRVILLDVQVERSRGLQRIQKNLRDIEEIAHFHKELIERHEMLIDPAAIDKEIVKLEWLKKIITRDEVIIQEEEEEIDNPEHVVDMQFRLDAIKTAKDLPRAGSLKQKLLIRKKVEDKESELKACKVKEAEEKCRKESELKMYEIKEVEAKSRYEFELEMYKTQEAEAKSRNESELEICKIKEAEEKCRKESELEMRKIKEAEEKCCKESELEMRKIKEAEEKCRSELKHLHFFEGPGVLEEELSSLKRLKEYSYSRLESIKGMMGKLANDINDDFIKKKTKINEHLTSLKKTQLDHAKAMAKKPPKLENLVDLGEEIISDFNNIFDVNLLENIAVKLVNCDQFFQCLEDATKPGGDLYSELDGPSADNSTTSVGQSKNNSVNSDGRSADNSANRIGQSKNNPINRDGQSADITAKSGMIGYIKGLITNSTREAKVEKEVELNVAEVEPKVENKPEAKEEVGAIESSKKVHKRELYAAIMHEIESMDQMLEELENKVVAQHEALSEKCQNFKVQVRNYFVAVSGVFNNENEKRDHRFEQVKLKKEEVRRTLLALRRAFQQERNELLVKLKNAEKVLKKPTELDSLRQKYFKIYAKLFFGLSIFVVRVLKFCGIIASRSYNDLCLDMIFMSVFALSQIGHLFYQKKELRSRVIIIREKDLLPSESILDKCRKTFADVIGGLQSFKLPWLSTT